MRATRLSVANYNTTLSSDSLETGTGSSNSLRSATQSVLFTHNLEVAENARVSWPFCVRCEPERRVSSRLLGIWPR